MSPARGVVWAMGSFMLFVAALFATLPILAIANWFTDLPHLTEMAAWSVVWGGLSLLGVLVAARVALGGWLAVNAVAVGLAAIGVALSAIVHVVLQQWELARFGVIDPDQVGWTSGLFAVLIGVAVAAFGALIAPKEFIRWPLLAVLLGFAGVAFIVLSNVPGLSDGLDGDSWPLAIWVGLSALYALGVAGIVIRRAIN